MNLIDIVHYLITRGAIINPVNKDGDTPLITAIVFENLELIKTLVENGADVNYKSTADGETPLHVSVIANPYGNN